MKRDSQIFDLIGAERKRQTEGIELIASENYVSDQVMEAMGSVLTNKYAEGYPGARYYGGCEVVDRVETLAIERVVRMVTEGVVTAVDGTDIPLRADSICVHGDGEKALLFVRRIRAALEAKGVALRAL